MPTTLNIIDSVLRLFCFTAKIVNTDKEQTHETIATTVIMFIKYSSINKHWNNSLFALVTSQHQRTDGVINHRLVIDGQQLFANTLGNRVKPRAGPSSEYYSFHCCMVLSF